MATPSRPACVVHFVDKLIVGGAEHALVQMATCVDRHRFRTVVVCFEQCAYHDVLAEAGCPVHIAEKRRAFDFGVLCRLVRLLRRERAALLHCHELQSAAYGAVASLLTRVPAIFTVQGEVVFKQPRARRLLPWIGRLHRRIVFVASWLRDLATNEFGVRPERTLVIHNAADLSRFQGCDIEGDAELARGLGIEPGTPVVGTVGNLRPVKDHVTLIRAFALVRERLPAAKLLIIGEGGERPRLESLTDELGLGGAVTLLGRRDDVPDLLPLFDVYVLSSTSEGLSLSIVEAMASERAVVATRVGGNPEVVAEGETGLLVPPSDPEAMAEAIVALLNDPERRKTLAAAGRRRAETAFSLHHMIGQYESVYDTLIHRR